MKTEMRPEDLSPQPVVVTDLMAAKELLVEAKGIEATYGPNAYSDYLRRHKCRPDPETAAYIGRTFGGRVKAADGKMYPKQEDKLLNPPMENSGETGNARAAPAMTGTLPIADAAPTISTGDRRLSNYPQSHFDDCPQHEWKAVDSQSDNEWRHGVVCTKCGCPGDADNESGDVVWPAT